MKRLLILAVSATVALTACDNLSLNGIAPKGVKDVFESMYPNAWDVEWEREGGKLVVDFNDGPYERESWFNNDGTWIQTRTELPLNEVPKVVIEATLTSLGSGWYIDGAVHYLTSSIPSEYYAFECEKVGSPLEVQVTVLPDGTILKTYGANPGSGTGTGNGGGQGTDPSQGSGNSGGQGTDPSQGSGNGGGQGTGGGQGNKPGGGDIFAAAMQTFSSMFPGARNVEWEMEYGKMNVEFIWQNAEKEAWFLTDGTWLSTETEIRLADVPKIVKEAALTSLGNGWRLEDAEFHEVNGTPSAFYVIECEQAYLDREVTLRITPDGTILVHN